jgi:hypothetical protein
MKSTPWTTALLLSGLMLAAPVIGLTAADAQKEPPARREPPHGPPPEAYLACEGKSAGEAVVFETPYGDEIEAICRYLDDRLVAKPINGPPPRPRDEKESMDEK